MTPFIYLEPMDLSAAVSLLVQHGQRAKVMAGGQSLILALKDRSLRPSFIVSLSRVPELRGIQYTPTGELEIGAAATYAEVGAAPMRGWHARISEVCLDLADRSVRNMGTLGGAVCQADPRFDIPTLLVGLDALLTIVGPLGRKNISASGFFLSAGRTRLDISEILTKLTIPAIANYSDIAFEKFRHRVFDAALVSVCCAVRLKPGNVVDAVRIAVGTVDRNPQLADRSAQLLLGKPMTTPVIAQIANETANEILPPDSLTAPLRSYQFELTRSLVKRAFSRMATET
jgi:carbon-monoxide dehydrogenase medium subunit